MICISQIKLHFIFILTLNLYISEEHFEYNKKQGADLIPEAPYIIYIINSIQQNKYLTTSNTKQITKQ